jgi:hypothetical protein
MLIWLILIYEKTKKSKNLYNKAKRRMLIIKGIILDFKLIELISMFSISLENPSVIMKETKKPNNDPMTA